MGIPTAQELAYHLRAMLKAAEMVQRLRPGNFSLFEGDRKAQAALARLVGIVGEAAENIPARVRDTHPLVPWQTLIEHGSRCLHEYYAITADFLWDYADNQATPLISQIRAVLESLPEDQP